MDNNTIVVSALPVVRIFGAISFILVSGSGIVLNMLLAMVLYKVRLNILPRKSFCGLFKDISA